MIPTKITWIIVFDSINCRIFNYHKNTHSLDLIKTIQHPENKLRDSDLTSDKPGRYKTTSSAHGTYTQPSDPKEVMIDQFIREIAKELSEKRKLNAYQRLIIMAADHVNGLFLKHCDKHVQKQIVQNIEKNGAHLPPHELITLLSNYLI